MATTDTTTVPGMLTQGDAIVLGKLLAGVKEGRKVTFSLNDGDTIRTGVLRHVVAGEAPSEWGFLHNDRDVRTGFVRITSLGFDMALPVTRIMDLIRDQMFVVEK
jgi:hypothetical protein